MKKLYIILSLFLSLTLATVTDIDGNDYETVQIGEQLWMAENLKVTHYNNGDEISISYSNEDWINIFQGSYVFIADSVDSDSVDIEPFEIYLYNGYSVEDERGVCPEGWHVPAYEEFLELQLYLEPDSLSLEGTYIINYFGIGHLLKLNDDSALSCQVSTPNANESGFSAIAAGFVQDGGYAWGGQGGSIWIWTATSYNNQEQRVVNLVCNNDYVINTVRSKNYGMSIRCLQDEISGCTDPEACNYDETANINDGSCDYNWGACLNCAADEIWGCGDESACNYDPNVNTYPECGADYDDCTYFDDCGVCDVTPDNDCTLGCTNPEACNYNSDATDEDGSCEYNSGTWHVSVDGDDGNCGSAEAPLASIQLGIDNASDGDSVLVSAGTYVENIIWPATNGIKLIGNGEDDCIIDGSTGDSWWEKTSVIRFNGDIAGIIDSTTIINGFTLQNGYDGWDDDNGVYGGAGGIYLFNASPNISNMIIKDNMSHGAGGIFCYLSNPTFTNVTITNNSTWEDCGAGILLDNSNPLLYNVIISNNSANEGGYGGGMHCRNYSNPILINVTITNNLAGSGLHIISNSSPSLVNCIIWDNYPHEISTSGWSYNSNPSYIYISYSDIQGGETDIITNDSTIVYWLDGNIDSNPMFTNPDSLDFTLQSLSPCIDAGDPESELDPDGTIADMGAYPYDQIANPIIWGCMDYEACNYNEEANGDDGSCISFDACGECGGTNDCVGCSDFNACNYSPDFTIDDGSCEYPAVGYNCDGDMIDCAGELLEMVIDNEGFAQITSSEDINEAVACYEFRLFLDAYNSFSNFDIESGDFLFVLVENEDEECVVNNIIDSGSFVKIQAKCDDEFIYDYSIDCSQQSYDTVIYNQTNITLMEIPNFPDICGLCGGDGSTCDDCAGIPAGPNYEDECGTCDDDPTNDCVQDCYDEWGGGAIIDECGVCDGPGPLENYDCDGNCIVAIDCNNDCGGSAQIDDCGICSEGNTGLEYNEFIDCAGVCFGSAVFDECGICNGDGSSCAMIGDINDDDILDILDIILMLNIILDGSTYNYLADLNEDENIDILDIVIMVNWILNGVPDCYGVPGGDAMEDACGVCNGLTTDPNDCISLDCPYIEEDLTAAAVYYESWDLENIDIINIEIVNGGLSIFDGLTCELDTGSSLLFLYDWEQYNECYDVYDCEDCIIFVFADESLGSNETSNAIMGSGWATYGQSLSCTEYDKFYEICIPNCVGQECGDDGCHGDCGLCSDGESCNAGQCEDNSAACSACLSSCSGFSWCCWMAPSCVCYEACH